jgi:hypothetical protein
LCIWLDQSRNAEKAEVFRIHRGHRECNDLSAVVPFYYCGKSIQSRLNCERLASRCFLPSCHCWLDYTRTQTGERLPL